MKISMLSGGKAGRIFQVKYGIGKNAYNGSGLFLFRLDYMDYRESIKKGLHYHLIFGGKEDEHTMLPGE